MENLNFEQIVKIVAAITPIINSLLRNWNASRNNKKRKRR